MNVMTYVKEIQKAKLEHVIKSHPTDGRASMVDDIHIDLILKISFFFRFVKILIFVISCSYFFAMAFQCMILIQADVNNWAPYDEDIELENKDHNNFFEAYKMENMTD